MEKHTAKDICPYCGGKSIPTYETPKCTSYLCGSCKEKWTSYKRRPLDADLLSGQSLQSYREHLSEGPDA